MRVRNCLCQRDEGKGYGVHLLLLICHKAMQWSSFFSFVYDALGHWVLRFLKFRDSGQWHQKFQRSEG